MRVIIAGSRDFKDYELLTKYCDIMLKQYSDITIVCGMAKGADMLGYNYAKERGFSIDEYPANWDDLTAKPCVIKHTKYGKPYNVLAGHNRNEEMAKNADILIAFWDEKSSGTANMISLVEKYKLIINIKVF